MVKKIIGLLILAFFLTATQVYSLGPISDVQAHEKILASHALPLNDRYAIASVSDVFKDNILLTLSYMSGKTTSASTLDWNTVRGDSTYEFVLQPGEVFAFHDDVLPEFAGKKIITTNAHFDASQGFVSDGYLVGDGVCHLASVMNWVARDAGLKVVAPTNHDFAVIPDVAKQYGTAIYYMPGEHAVNQAQNLYIENTLQKPVKFVFHYAHNELKVQIDEQN